ncbi:hypothetical protein AAHC03_013482 [Spirometra sp. Aus1]
MFCSPYPMVYDTPGLMPLQVEQMPCQECDNLAETEMQEMIRNQDYRRMTESTDRRNTWRMTNGTINTVSDFEETQWIPIDDTSVFQNHELMFKRTSSFQKSVELPNGCIISLNVYKPQETMVKDDRQTPNSAQINQIQISGRVRQWRRLEKVAEEVPFEETLYLPQNADMNSITYKLQSKNLHRNLSRSTFGYSRNAATSYEDDLEESEIMYDVQNTVVVFGKVELYKAEPKPMKTWSKEYRQLVSGQVRISNGGKADPVISAYTDVPDFLAVHTSTPDKDTTYAVLDNGCQIKIKIDKNVDRESIKFINDTRSEKYKVLFDRHVEEGETSNGHTDYDMQVNQLFRFSRDRYDLENITGTIQDDCIILFAPFLSPEMKS